MDEIKEKINYNLKNTYTSSYSHGLLTALNHIEQAEQDYIFVRVPRKMKLSELIEKLKKDNLNAKYDFECNLLNVKELNSNIGTLKINFYNSKIDVIVWLEQHCSFYYRYFRKLKWLYDMAGITEIEVDV